ncbi:MAG: Hg(II)-responsive transcriptional regulator [Rudaea sp.]|uniref:Hg(II)-responsive transcriptional regulator n=1 Tax=unclassified Rudaea TaxID=2627037 RepID=UPI0010F4A5F9|nr:MULTISPECIES: Hg(II)-responsive transcriptional regulator [unclassified Rudaea]MBN8888476.1 Hg(II)-responsive transcriptional regulator [Rudaea sp.]MBQ3301078.1 Hg(II)-responsive transcriptional regulator [Eggerthellaceae bacterium]MBR0345272.1 Hg(II)-responsive transcriptional regulator [Rudaea sp.]
MSRPRDNLSIGALAETAAVNIETIRFYQRKGLMAEPARPPGGIRRYGHAELARVRFIKSAQRLGFSLNEIAELLSLDDGTHCRDARRIAAHKLDDMRGKLADLRRMEAALKRLVARCDATHGTITCPLIASFK